jgi:hypothetical protein
MNIDGLALCDVGADKLIGAVDVGGQLHDVVVVVVVLSVQELTAFPEIAWSRNMYSTGTKQMWRSGSIQPTNGRGGLLSSSKAAQ